MQPLNLRQELNQRQRVVMHLLPDRLTFDLGGKKEISEKNVLNLVKLPSLASKCCKVRKYNASKVGNFVYFCITGGSV